MFLQPARNFSHSLFYTDVTGSYKIAKIIQHLKTNPLTSTAIPLDHFLERIQIDGWSSSEIPKTREGFRSYFEKSVKLVKSQDYRSPILVSNFNRLIDGIDRIFKAVSGRQKLVDVIFIEPSELNRLKESTNLQTHRNVSDLPIPDRYLSVPSGSFPSGPAERKQRLEEYFPDHLPSFTSQGDGDGICLERPSSPYGCLDFDEDIRKGLGWWTKGTRIRDICAEYRPRDFGLLALEEQWIPLSWSLTFQKRGGIPKEAVLLHLDDHRDMMMPRIGLRLDGKMVDYISGNRFDLLEPESVVGAIESGAIGKGSILTPLIWSIPNIHVRHLSYRPYPAKKYQINKITVKDDILFPLPNRIGIDLIEAPIPSNTQSLAYLVTPVIDDWLDNLPDDLPIIFHFDLDYFNNRFDGDSSWQTNPNARLHDIGLDEQLQQLTRIIEGIRKRDLFKRIVDFSIGISPGFYPAEYWQSMVESIERELHKLKEEYMNPLVGDFLFKTSSTNRPKRKNNQELQVVAASRRSLSDVELPKRDGTRENKAKRQKQTDSSKTIDSSRVIVQKMKAKDFEGWKIEVDGNACGFVKFHPKLDQVFKSHVSVDFQVPKPKQGKHIGRIALQQAIESSAYSIFVAHLRKSNIASKKALEAVGFQECENPESKQLTMIFRK